MANLSDKELIQELENRFSENKRALFELQKLTQELKEVNQKLEESESIKSHFLSHIRNEIINPLSSIIGISKNIQQLPNDKLFKIFDFSKLIHNEAFELDQQLRNIFAAAEIEAGEFNPSYSYINIKNLVEEEVENYQEKLISKKLECKINFENIANDEAKILTDDAKLRLIFSNIFRNAIKFSKEYGKINISITINSDNIILETEDYGIGISEKNLKIIFDRFKKVDNSINSINRGHGLGLSIALAYVDLLNGKIDVTSKIGLGTKFTVQLPIINKTMINDENTILNEFLFEDDTELF